MTYNSPEPYGSMPPPPPAGYRAGGVPGQVTTAAVLLFISGGFSVLGGLLLVALGSVSGIFVVVGIVLLIIGGVEIWVGVALRQLKSWARTAAIVIAGIGAVLSVISLIKGSYTNVISLALDAVIIYMLTRPEAVRAFESPGR